MLNNYVSKGIDLLNETTSNLKNLNNLAIYLSKQNDVNALKVLKLMLISSNISLNKTLDINYVNSNDETIINNLSKNQHNLGLELVEKMIRDYFVDFNKFFSEWIYNFVSIISDNSLFYNRVDMIDKRIDIVTCLVVNNLLSVENVIKLKDIFQRCNKIKRVYTNTQLIKMNNIVSYICFTENCSNIENLPLYLINDYKSYKPKDRTIANDRIDLINYQMTKSQCDYIDNDIRSLIKLRKIK